MNAQRIRNTRTSINKFMVETEDLADDSADLRAVLGSMKQFFLARYSHAGNVSKTEWDATMSKERTVGQSTELENFMRTLDGPRQRGDFSRSMVENPRYYLHDNQYIGLGALTARLWKFIDNYRGFETDNEEIESAKVSMRYGVFRAIADCIEDDGHRVCGVGLSQRLILVAQGRCNGVHVDDRPTPAAFLNHAALSYFKYQLKEREPTDQEIETFFRETDEQSQALYGDDEFEENDIKVKYHDRLHSDLLAFLGMSYDWSPGSPSPRAQSVS
jgi:hypothetical protein